MHICTAQNIAMCQIEGKDAIINEMNSEIAHIIHAGSLMDECTFQIQGCASLQKNPSSAT